jgi:DNA-binding CsgD family transcriptional regulator
MRPQREAKATGRELQILELAAEGNTDKQIASNLGISKDTVASYWRRILLKYDAVSRTEVVARHAEQKAMVWVKEQGEEAVRLASEVSVRTKAEARELDQRNLLQAITECSLDFISGKRGYREVFDRYLQYIGT